MLQQCGTLGCNSVAPLRILGALALTGVLITCGTPTFVYIAPVGRGIIDVSSIEFSHNTDNDIDQFNGYNIYYKFYDNSDDGAACKDDKSHIEDSSVVVLGPQRLLERKYRLLIRDDNRDNVPVIAVSNKGQRHTFRLVIADDQATANPLPSKIEFIDAGTGTTTDIFLYRNVTETSSASNYKPLRVLQGRNSEYLSGDTDVSASNTNITDIGLALNNSSLYVAFYVIGDGLDDNFQRIYGEARFLGYISMFRQPSSNDCPR